MVARILAFIALLLAPSAETERAPQPRPDKPRVEYRDSTALGTYEAGSLVDGVRFPGESRHHFTWDPIRREQPDRTWRRWGTDDLVRTTLGVVRDFAHAHPGAPRVGVGDLSLPEGGYFGAEVSGGIGHTSHQNGLDIDVYYPLRSEAERAPLTVDEVDVRLAQDEAAPFTSTSMLIPRCRRDDRKGQARRAACRRARVVERRRRNGGSCAGVL